MQTGKAWAGIALATLAALCAGQAAAQELRCNQVFMNPSEKRICASAELQALDREMAHAYRRVEGQMPDLEKVQRKFRRALKTCKGDDACLAQSYQVRIGELQGFINTLTPPTEEEALALGDAADRAAERVEQERAEFVPEPEPEPEPVAEIEAAAPVPIVEPTPAPAPEPAAAATSNSESSDGSWLLVLIVGAIVVWIISMIVKFVAFIRRAFGRCPSCKRWNVASEVSVDQEAYTDHRTVNRKATYKNNRHETVRTKEWKEREAYRVVEKTFHMRCCACGHSWTYITRRSS